MFPVKYTILMLATHNVLTYSSPPKVAPDENRTAAALSRSAGQKSDPDVNMMLAATVFCKLNAYEFMFQT